MVMMCTMQIRPKRGQGLMGYKKPLKRKLLDIADVVYSYIDKVYKTIGSNLLPIILLCGPEEANTPMRCVTA